MWTAPAPIQPPGSSGSTAAGLAWSSRSVVVARGVSCPSVSSAQTSARYSPDTGRAIGPAKAVRQGIRRAGTASGRSGERTR